MPELDRRLRGEANLRMSARFRRLGELFRPGAGYIMIAAVPSDEESPAYLGRMKDMEKMVRKQRKGGLRGRSRHGEPLRSIAASG